MKKILKNTDNQNLKNQTIEFFKDKKETLKELNNDTLNSLDDDNFNQLIESYKQNKTENTEKSNKKIYKIDNPTSLYKRRLRKTQKNLMNSIIIEHDKKVQLKLFNDFKEFYKEYYFLNDFSEESFRANNADLETKNRIKLFLQVIKREKLI